METLRRIRDKWPARQQAAGRWEVLHVNTALRNILRTAVCTTIAHSCAAEKRAVARQAHMHPADCELAAVEEQTAKGKLMKSLLSHLGSHHYKKEELL